MWKKNFIQWCFIGVPMGFSLWLADKTLTGIIAAGGDPKQMGNPLIYAIPAIILIVGFLMSLQTSAIGAKAVISVAKKSGKATLAAANELGSRTRAGQWARDKASAIGANIAGATGFAPANYPQRLAAERLKKAKENFAGLTDAQINSKLDRPTLP